MTQLAEIRSLNAELMADYRLLQAHWRTHPLGRFRHNKVLFIAAGAALVWLSRYPSVRRTYLLASLVTKSPFN